VNLTCTLYYKHGGKCCDLRHPEFPLRVDSSIGEEEIDIAVVEFSLDMICEKQSDDGQISGATRTLTFIPMKKMRQNF
jgi:hypothetical protein